MYKSESGAFIVDNDGRDVGNAFNQPFLLKKEGKDSSSLFIPQTEKILGLHHSIIMI